MFSQVQPELLLNDLSKPDKQLHISSENVSRLTYHHCAGQLLGNQTYEEIDVLYDDMQHTIEQRGERCGGESVFALLPEYTLQVLDTYENEPICRQDQLLNWRYCYLYLGQDLLTTAHMAYVDTQGFRHLDHFTWPAQIRTDDRRLDEILKKGLAENHFHLNGSTRCFDLTWICLMNHPSRILTYFGAKVKQNEYYFFNLFKENLNAGVSLGADDNRFDWILRLKIACWIRAALLLWLKFDDENAVDKKMNSVQSLLRFIENSFSITPLDSMVDAARHQLRSVQRRIDYAITRDALPDYEADDCCRSLAGERAFMYNAFKYIYSKTNDDKAQMKRFMDLFYLYLLIKTQFRSEMIQVNQRYGFKNFALYQNRKDKIFDIYPVYDREAKNLSVIESMKNGSVRSLEMRLGPWTEADSQITAIRNTDRLIMSLADPTARPGMEHHGFSDSNDYFYVLHFPKFPDTDPPKKKDLARWAVNPRNSNVRETTEKQAMAIAGSLEKEPYLCRRIRGIDACNFEIGCRPEVFATAFRFLKNFFISGHKRTPLCEESFQPHLNATYHAGEDFMDLVDGLRAIDEAILFLELSTGERIGHAMALGVSAPDYYALKRNKIVLKKQDHLDDIVWALKKSQDNGIYIDSILKQQLEEKAHQLIYHIYGGGFSLMDYYNGWRLRGDDPELYRYERYDGELYEKPLKNHINGASYWYNKHKKMNYESMELDPIRHHKNAAKLCSMYHFDFGARDRGNETEAVRITEQYVSMVTALQDKMMKELAGKHIGIETNPSSNVLIGPFDQYAQHPIFRFFPVSPSAHETVQFVSVNTDDQGVFDTSLAMEYSFLACTLRSIKDENQEQVYSDDAIYSYLEKLRENGFSQAFNH